MNKVLMAKYGKHGLTYRFWLNKIFSHFNVECGPGKIGSLNQVFNVTALEDNECIPRKSGAKLKSIVVDLLDVKPG